MSGFKTRLNLPGNRSHHSYATPCPHPKDNLTFGFWSLQLEGLPRQRLRIPRSLRRLRVAETKSRQMFYFESVGELSMQTHEKVR